MFLPPLKIIDDVLIRYLLRPAGLEPTTFGSWRRVDCVEKCSNPLGRVDKLLFCLLRLATVAKFKKSGRRPDLEGFPEFWAVFEG